MFWVIIHLYSEAPLNQLLYIWLNLSREYISILFRIYPSASVFCLIITKHFCLIITKHSNPELLKPCSSWSLLHVPIQSVTFDVRRTDQRIGISLERPICFEWQSLRNAAKPSACSRSPCFFCRSVPRAGVVFMDAFAAQLGCHVQWACSVRGVDGCPTALANQLPRVASSMPCPGPPESAVTGQACAGPHRQHCDRWVHQPSESLVRLRLTCSGRNSTPCPGEHLVQMDWRTTGPGAFANMCFPQWPYLHRPCAKSGRTRSRSPASCALLARPDLVAGTHAPRDSPSLANPSEEEPYFSKMGHPLASTSRPLETPCLVPGKKGLGGSRWMNMCHGALGTNEWGHGDTLEQNNL